MACCYAYAWAWGPVKGILKFEAVLARLWRAFQGTF